MTEFTCLLSAAFPLQEVVTGVGDGSMGVRARFSLQ